MRMGKEIANGDGIILNREEAGDRDLIMDIRHHKFEYDEIMALVTKEEEELNAAIASSKLPNDIDFDLVNSLLIEIRKKYYII
jgi:pyridoxal biosynthesis lyase PdxS